METEDFEDVYIGRQSAKWIDDIPDDFPWFLLVSFIGPHNPFDPPEEYIKRYQDKDIPLPEIDNLEGKPNWMKNWSSSFDCGTEEGFEKVKKTRQHYAAYVELIDEQIGEIISSLEKREMMENTYIIFTSDHGEMLGDHGLYRKHVAYEPSIHVPLIIAGPGIKKGKTSDVLVELIDLHATVCDLAQVSFCEEKIDSKSLLPVLQGKTDHHRDNVITAERGYRCLRTQRYKFIQNSNDKNELYDLIEDPGEMNNIVNEKGEIAQELFDQLYERYREGGWMR